MLISYVIPAYKAGGTIHTALSSIFSCTLLHNWEIEVIVVDDGSHDEKLVSVVANFSHVYLIKHPYNKGTCAARNTGVSMSKGEVVIILDADDTLVSQWPSVLHNILQDWPRETYVCFAACKNLKGVVTADSPNYQGYLSLKDLLNERNSGEYIPLFRGSYVRAKPHIDLNIKKICGIVSYINYAQDAPIWVSREVLRIYHDEQCGSISSGWTSVFKARETVICYQALFERFSSLYESEAPRAYRTKRLRYAVYLRLAKQKGYWSIFQDSASLMAFKETVGCFVILILGPKIGAMIARLVKKLGIVRKYG